MHIVEAWSPPVSPATARNISVYSNAQQVRLRVNGKVHGQPHAIRGLAAATGTPWQPDSLRAPDTFTTAFFPEVPFAAGRIVAEAMDAAGAVVAMDTAASWGAPASVLLSLDAPNPAHGMGRAVYLDGQDVALVRATIVDASGNVCHDAAVPVTFAVDSGPGLVWGVGNGDASCHEPNHSPRRSSYHGLARAVIRVTVDAAGSLAERVLRSLINKDAGKGSRSSKIHSGTNAAAAEIVVSATAPGLEGAKLSIPLSVDERDSVLRVAEASVSAAYTGD